MILAAERGRRLPPREDDAEPGRGVYFVALDEMPTMAQASDLAARAMNRRLRLLVYWPPLACRIFGWFNDLLSRVIKRPILLTSDKMAEGMAGSWICSCEKAKREMGFTCRIGLREGFETLVTWYREQGWLKKWL